jgi:predicted O-linked N-acetylglucosamine transferase (SPINDLY family)
LLTLEGSTFQGRVASSLLHAAHLSELVIRSQEQYEKMAVQLANDPGALQRLRRKIEETRSTCPLFDTDLFRRNIKAIYVEIWERQQQGILSRETSRW